MKSEIYNITEKSNGKTRLQVGSIDFVIDGNPITLQASVTGGNVIDAKIYHEDDAIADELSVWWYGVNYAGMKSPELGVEFDPNHEYEMFMQSEK